MIVLPWPRRWSAKQAALCAGVGGLAMAASQWLGPNAWPIWLVPGCIIILALRARRRELLAAWLLLAAGASVPLLAMGWHGWAWAIYTGAMALDLLLMTLLARWLALRRGALGLVVGFAAARAVVELAWAQTPYGELFAWGLYRIDSMALAQVINFVGVSALSSIICFLAAAVATMITDPERPGALRTLAIAVSLLMLELGVGLGRMERPASETLRVAAISDLGGDPARLVELTEAAAGELARVVVWPDGSLSLTDQNAGEIHRLLSAVANENNIWLVAGVRRESTGESLAVTTSPLGVCDLATAYRQRHPSPFGLTVTPGTAPPQVSEALFGGLSAICGYDLVFPEPALLASINGATVLAVPTFGLPHPARHQAALLRARALENSLIVVRASRRGWCGIADPLGRLAAGEIVERDPHLALVADVPLERAGSLLGDARLAFPWLMFAAFLTVVPRRRPRDGRLTRFPYAASYR